MGGFQNYLHLMYGLPNGWVNQSTSTGVLWVNELRKKKKRKKKALEKLDDIFGNNKPGFLELMDDDYNQKVKLILMTLLMEDDE